MPNERSSALPPDLAQEIAEHIRSKRGTAARPLCPMCARRPQETDEGICFQCSLERRERTRAKKRRWWTKHADAARMARRSLEELAEDIHEAYDVGRESYETSLEAYLAMGRDLLQARRTFRSDQDFGAWFRRQHFPFGQRWARTLRAAAEREDEIRAAVGSQLPTGTVSIEKALRTVRIAAGEIAAPEQSAPSCRHCPIHCECA